MEDVKKCLTVLNNVLLTKTFLVGERVTLADISVGCNLLMLYRQVCDKKSDVLLLCCVRLHMSISRCAFGFLLCCFHSFHRLPDLAIRVYYFAHIITLYSSFSHSISVINECVIRFSKLKHI